jgi:DNA (cytosine-5)-methyltransferase 1
VTATIHRLGSTVDAIDLFCGYGGSSQGIHASGADVRLAANHNQLAIDCHAANYPNTEHCRADLSDPDQADYIDVQDLPPARFLWASPSCKFHSQANSKKLYALGSQRRFFEEEFDQVAYANSERSRVTMVCPLRYAAKHHPELVVIENVVECAKWGPDKDGSTFRWWLSEWSKLGYEHETLFLNSQFFPPCPQSRDRMYVVFWRRGNTPPNLNYLPTALCISDRCQGAIVKAEQTWKPRTRAWPLDRWGKYESQYTYNCPDCRARVHPVAWPAYTAIDWTNLGPRMDERESLGMAPLADTTMERIRRGLMKFRGGPPIVIPAKAVWGSDHQVTDPFSCQTSQQDKALAIQGAVLPVGSEHGLPRRLDETISTVTASGGSQAFIGRAVVADTSHTHSAAHRGANRTRSMVDQLQTLTADSHVPVLATEGITIPNAGNTFEHGGYSRSKALSDSMFTQHTTLAFGFAHTPMTVKLRGTADAQLSGSVESIADSLDTISAGGGHHGIASPALFQKINGEAGDTAWHHVGERLNTVTGRDTHGLIVLPWIDQWRSDPAAISEQLATVMTHARHSLASIEANCDPITDADLQQVRFRMLDPDPELRRAMAFDDSYILLGNKSQMTSGLGNAVTPPVAQWVTERCLESLGGGSTNAGAA